MRTFGITEPAKQEDAEVIMKKCKQGCEQVRGCLSSGEGDKGFKNPFGLLGNEGGSL
jgi:hypothetical protein